MKQQRNPRTLRTGMVAAMAAGALIVAGCAADGEEAQSTESGEAPADVETSFSFTFATSNNLESPYETLSNEYMAANEGVTITINPTPNDKYGETIRTQLQAGNASDVIQTTPGSGDARGLIPLAEAGFLEPLGETAAALVPAGSEEVFTIDGEVYGQPLDFTIAAVVASMGTAAQNGVTEFPETLDQLYTECESLVAGGKSFFAVAGGAGPNAGLLAQAISASRVYGVDPEWNGKRAAGETTFAETEGWAEALQTIIDLNDKGCFQPGVEGAGFDAITNGLSQGTSIGGFIPSGAAIEISKAAPPEADFRVQPFPIDSGGTQTILASSNYTMSINAKSEAKEAAKAFLEWLATPEAQQRYNELSGELPISAYKDMDLSDTIYAPVVDLLAAGAYAPLPSNIWPNPSIYDALQVGVQGLLTGQKTVEQVLADLDNAWDQ